MSELHSIGTVHLRVADVERMLRYYEDVIGLRVHERQADQVRLGTGGPDLLVFHHYPDGARPSERTGLYHFALLVPSRFDLAVVLKHFADDHTPLHGLSEHITSEAIYLSDPEGNGIEIYRDRDRDYWDEGDSIRLATMPLDVQDLLREIGDQDASWTGLPEGTVMGHIHLHVNSVPAAEAFYGGLLGMEVMFNVGSATFMAYDLSLIHI
ncbi:MAG: hypothetical protein GYB68_19535, partial [Chloroflexi bacterium]|nr:hypothetical protein [Chloroflexota bacterium]